MTVEAFELLADYSMSIPGGAYAGKMWRSRINGHWRLRWYGTTEFPGILSCNSRAILIC